MANPERAAFLSRFESESRPGLNGAATQTASTVAAPSDEDALLTQHFSGLGEFYFERGDYDRATQLFNLARSRSRCLHRPAVFLAKIAIDRNDSKSALDYLEDARRTNPFSLEICSLLGTVYLAVGDFERAIAATIDAMLLAGETDVDESLDFGDRIRMLWAELEAASDDDLSDRIHARRERIRAQQEHLLEVASERPRSFDNGGRSATLRPELSPYRRFPMLADLDDADLVDIAKALDITTYSAGSQIFAEGDDSNSLYLVAKGSLQIRKVCSVGSFVLHTLREGEVAGRMNFLDGRPHAAHAFAGEPLEVYALPRSRAEDLMLDRRHIAVSMLLYFWRTLAQHIRDSNHLMKSVLSPGVASAEMFLDEGRRADAEQFAKEMKNKAATDTSRGLDIAEIRLLSALAGEESFRPGELVFGEGASGDKLYIVTGGRVQISRTNRGREDVLAVLGPGEVFGEMALVDSQPRSASARAAAEDTNAIAIHKDTVDMLVETDQESAQQFISLICRILSKRLRELDETIIKWRILTGIR